MDGAGSSSGGNTSSGADGCTVGKDGRVDWLAAGLDGAVTKTVTEVGVGAVASGIVCRASELSVGDGDHVSDTFLSACWKTAWDCLGRDHGNEAGDEGD